ncbi:hypothetical protein, partial [uncultured Alistipes sp.]|uniref:hypothetical protein n=1 Tax=uncultured Alistipes sp. TaxID=538949 RepID=UPI00263A7331
CPCLFVSLTASKILPLGKTQASLLLPSLIRIFGFAQDTSPRQIANKFAFALGLFVSLTASKILPLGKKQAYLFLPSLIRIFVIGFDPVGMRTEGRLRRAASIHGSHETEFPQSHFSL